MCPHIASPLPCRVKLQPIGELKDHWVHMVARWGGGGGGCRATSSERPGLRAPQPALACMLFFNKLLRVSKAPDKQLMKSLLQPNLNTAMPPPLRTSTESAEAPAHSCELPGSISRPCTPSKRERLHKGITGRPAPAEPRPPAPRWKQICSRISAKRIIPFS